MRTTFDNAETTILAPQGQRFGNAHPTEILLTTGYVREIAEALQDGLGQGVRARLLRRPTSSRAWK